MHFDDELLSSVGFVEGLIGRLEFSPSATGSLEQGCGFDLCRTLDTMSIRKSNCAALYATHQEFTRDWD